MSSALSKSQTVIVTAGQNVPNLPLDNFIARSVTIDNPTGQWFYLPNQQRWIAPYTLGTIISLNSGQDGASSLQSGASLVNIQSQTPNGQVSRPVSGQTATFVYSTDAHANAAGTSLQSGIQQTRVLNAILNSIPSGPDTVFFTYTVPAGIVTQIDLLTSETSITTSAAQAHVAWSMNANDGTGYHLIAVVESDTTAQFSTIPMQVMMQPGMSLQAKAGNTDTQIVSALATVVLREVRTV